MVTGLRSVFTTANRVVDNPVELIGDQILLAATASVSFIVPVGYGILLLFWHDLYGDQATNQSLKTRFNGDAGANYDVSQVAFGSASSTLNASTFAVFAIFGRTDPNETHNSGFITIFNRAGQEKVIIGTECQVFKAGGAVEDVFAQHLEGKWRNTSAEINAILLYASAGNMTAGSCFTLLGVKI